MVYCSSGLSNILLLNVFFTVLAPYLINLPTFSAVDFQSQVARNTISPSTMLLPKWIASLQFFLHGAPYLLHNLNLHVVLFACCFDSSFQFSVWCFVYKHYSVVSLFIVPSSFGVLSLPFLSVSRHVVAVCCIS